MPVNNFSPWSVCTFQSKHVQKTPPLQHRRQKRSLSSWSSAGPGRCWSAGTGGNCHSSSACRCGPKWVVKQIKSFSLCKYYTKPIKSNRSRQTLRSKVISLQLDSFFLNRVSFWICQDEVWSANPAFLPRSDLSPSEATFTENTLNLVKVQLCWIQSRKRLKFMKRYEFKKESMGCKKKDGAAPAWL